jgi:multidrug efflux pump subunit AcrA (membrane-fusion protein)
MRTFKTLRNLILGELSMVDFPAQTPAVAHITKRKRLVELHSTSTTTPVKKDQETTMTDAEKQALADAQANKEALAKAQAAVTALTSERDATAKLAEAILDLDDAQRSFAKKLSPADRAVFVAKGMTERTAQVEAARGKEVYKRRDGKTFYESDNPEIVALWKRDDEREARLEKIESEKTDAVMKSRVQKSLGNVGGKDDGKVVLLKAVAAIADEEQRKLAEAVLEKANSQCARSFERHSSGGSPDILDESDDDVVIEKKRDEIAKRLQTKNPDLQWLQAMQKAEESKEYADLVDSLGNR